MATLQLPSAKFREKAKGRWPSLLQLIGIEASFLRNVHGPCPICAGKDRFRFDNLDGAGTWFCSQCGPGDGLKLAKAWLKLDLMGTIRRLEEVLENAKEEKPKPKPKRGMGWVHHTWQEAAPLRSNAAVCAWWLRRVGSMPDCPDLRSATLRDPKTETWWPGMLALVRDEEGRVCGNHRTFLDPRGEKAPVEDPRRTFGYFSGGSAIRLLPAAEHMGVAEGIETAYAAHLYMGGLPVWATMTADLLASWNWPKIVKRLTIFGDLDSSFTGQAATYTLAKRAKARGLEVEAVFPETMDEDFNDVWNRERGAA